MKREGCYIRGLAARERDQHYPPMHCDGLRILPFLITHARTYTVQFHSASPHRMFTEDFPAKR